VIACAVVGKANVIVSGDRDLLALEHIGGILIQSAAQFLEKLWRVDRVRGTG
jgi:predicted nucleic acid-binding protein